MTIVATGTTFSRSAHGASFLPRYLSTRRLAAICGRTRSLSLTFDDGPGERVTNAVMEMLGANRASGTFFLLGARATAAPHIVDRLRERGHELGCHTDQHRHPWRTAPWRALADIDEGYRALERWVPPDGLFRPPFGKLTPLTWFALRRRGATTAWWTVDSGDTHDVSPSQRQIVDQVARGGGGVVLLHDFDRTFTGREQREAYTLELTEKLLLTARREGIAVRRFGEIMALAAGLGGKHHVAR